MDNGMDELLGEHAEIQRQLDRWKKESKYGEARVRDGKWEPDLNACWPQWRIALALSSAPDIFDRWWRKHGSKCESCSERRESIPEGMLDPKTPGSTGPVPSYAHAEPVAEECVTLGVIFDESWPLELALEGTALLEREATAEEMPCVEFHKLEGEAEEGIESLWLVTWDNLLFLLVTGAKEKIEKWEEGALMLSPSGRSLGAFVKADERASGLLAPSGEINGVPALCSQSQCSLKELTIDRFSIPDVFSKKIRLVALSTSKSRVQSIVTDFASENIAPVFVAALPEEVDDAAECLTLNFYVRLLHWQGRLDATERRRLMNCTWLASDLRESFSSAEHGE